MGDGIIDDAVLEEGTQTCVESEQVPGEDAMEIIEDGEEGEPQ